MSIQSTLTVETRPSLNENDLHALIESHKSPGIVILNGLGEVLHLNDAAWDMLTLLRQHGSSAQHGVMPQAVTDLCEELQTKLKGHHPGSSHRRMETTRLMGTAGEGVLLRGSAFEGGVDSPVERRRFLVVLDHITEHSQKPTPGKERFGLTERECQVADALTKGLTNKEIGNALGITEPTVKAHIKHMMEKMKCTTRTGIVSLLAGYSVGTS